VAHPVRIVKKLQVVAYFFLSMLNKLFDNSGDKCPKTGNVGTKAQCPGCPGGAKK